MENRSQESEKQFNAEKFNVNKLFVKDKTTKCDTRFIPFQVEEK